jgi:hypothetical protein
MNFTSQICTSRSQSERLLSLGLKKETADMFYSHDKGEEIYAIRACWGDFWDSKKLIYGHIRRHFIPAWSLHRLLYLIPNEYFTDVDFQDIMQRCIFATSALYDDLIDLIEALIKEEYFYKEYLEE